MCYVSDNERNKQKLLCQNFKRVKLHVISEIILEYSMVIYLSIEF